MKINKLAFVSLVILILITLGTLTASIWVPFSPYEMDAINKLLPPSASHWFGTDNFGRDIFSRVVYAARISLSVGALVSVIATVAGTISGLISGYYPKVDNVFMRVIDGVMSIPPILLALALVAALGGSLSTITISLSFAFWPVMTRVVRSSTLQIRNIQFVEAAQASGIKDVKILFRYILPNAIAPIIVQGTFIFAKAVLAEAALSFLGVGIEPPTPTWGNMLGDSRDFLTIMPWYSIFPGIAIVITVLALNILGDGLRDMMDPHKNKSKKRKKKKEVKDELKEEAS